MINYSLSEISEILRRLSEGDESAFRDIYNRYWKSVYKTADRYLQDKDLAQDIVQEVFASLWQKRESFGHVENLESYLVVVTQNFTYKQIKKSIAESRNYKIYLSGIDPESNNNIEDALLSKQYETLLQQAIDLLPPQQRQVFLLAREEGLTHEAIATRLNISQGTVKNHMVRALGTIRTYLAPHISTCIGVTATYFLLQ
jgi:RNA polymerase sigma-70 factor (family 1)